MRTIDEIIVHCTATFPEQKVDIETLRRWHKQCGFTNVGYHYLIDLEGNVLLGRPIEEKGAHCVGHNEHSIGVAYAGGLNNEGVPEDTRNEKQKETLLRLLKELKQRFPDAVIYGHRDFSKKACPCFDARTEYAEL